MNNWFPFKPLRAVFVSLGLFLSAGSFGSVPDALHQHNEKLAKKIYKVSEEIYLAVGYGLANSAMIIGDDGVIIVDTLESIESANEVLAEFRKITQKPIRAVVLSHNHYDHVSGIQAFVEDP